MARLKACAFDRDEIEGMGRKESAAGWKHSRRRDARHHHRRRCVTERQVATARWSTSKSWRSPRGPV